MQYSEVIDPSHNSARDDVQGEKSNKAPQKLVAFPFPFPDSLQNCQLEFSCVKQLSSTVKEVAAALLRAAFE